MSRVAARHLWLLLAGFTLWSAAFAALYGLQGAGCAFGWDVLMLGPVSLLRLLLVALYLAFVAAAGALLLVHRRRARTTHAAPPPLPLLAGSGAWLTAAAFGATVLVFLPTVATTACALP